MPSPPPTVPIPYVLEERLGSGSQGTTWRARHAETGAPAAVKILRLADAESWKSHDLFEREREVLASLDHPGVPRLLAAHHDDDRAELYLVMELREGMPLSRALAAGRSWSRRELTELLREALGILDYLHRRDPPVIHRDVKPGNLLRADDGRLSLVDFGGVRTALTPDGGSTVVGTFGYMAPEQLHGDASARSDIYALGATVAALATGRDAAELPRRRLEIDLSGVMPESPLRDVLAGMLALDPDDRYPDARAVLAALDTAATRPKAPLAPRHLASLSRRLPGGPIGLLARLTLVAIWLGTTALDAVLWSIERVFLPASYRQRRRRLLAQREDWPARADRELERLDRKHARRLSAVRTTRHGLRTITDRSEPYATTDGRPTRTGPVERVDADLRAADRARMPRHARPKTSARFPRPRSHTRKRRD